MEISISTSPAAAERARNFRDRRAHHLARHGVDRWLARRHGQSGQRHGAHPRARLEADAAPGRGLTHRGEHERAMGHVGIVAGILDHPGGGGVRVPAIDRQRKGHALAAWKRDLDRIGKFPGEEGGEGGLARSRRTGAGGPAAAEGACLVHGTGNRRLPPACHREAARP